MIGTGRVGEWPLVGSGSEIYGVHLLTLGEPGSALNPSSLYDFVPVRPALLEQTPGPGPG